MKQLNVFPECNVDTNLIGHLLGCPVKHKSTCNEVVKAINNADFFAIGIIDADKRMATIDGGFKEYMQTEKQDGKHRHVAMYVHEDGKRYMFTVKPAMDKFILDAAKQQRVDMSAAGYPDTLDEFKKVTKRIQAAKDSKLRNLFELIKGNPEMQRFKNTIKYLMGMLYDSDPDTAKQFFNGELNQEDLQKYLQK